MKTTIDIGDPLFAQARDVAAREKTTLKALVEEGLRRVLGERARRKPFKFRPVTFRGRGMSPDLADAPWSAIRDAIYGDAVYGKDRR